MGVTVVKASAVVVQRVPAGLADWFMEWQDGVTGAAERFAGYRSTDVYPPPDREQNDWVVVMHFDSEELLQAWLASPVRAHWVDKLRAQVGTFELTTLPGGFGAWFTSQARGPAAPPSWKMALAVLFGLYPTVMVLTLFPGPYTAPLGMAIAMLIGNLLSVCILQWAVMPVLNIVLAPWLQANSEEQRALSIGGLIAMVVLLVVMALLFRLVTG
jgi:uncharacterized protein